MDLDRMEMRAGVNFVESKNGAEGNISIGNEPVLRNVIKSFFVIDGFLLSYFKTAARRVGEEFGDGDFGGRITSKLESIVDAIKTSFPAKFYFLFGSKRSEENLASKSRNFVKSLLKIR